jgi:hypothetical protein
MIMLFLALVSWGASAQMNHSKMDHSMNGMTEMNSKMASKSATTSTIMVEHSLSATPIINNYLALKDALVGDDGKKAALFGKMLFDVLGKYDVSGQPTSQQKELTEILDDAKENAEHISENGDKIDHQREHFEILSTDIKDLVVITGTDRTLYQIYCPMFDNNKGGKWLSESNEIKNPLLGSKMMKCGSVSHVIAIK